MRKILGLILSLTMLITTVVPTYASTTSDIATKKVFSDTMKNTVEKVFAEMYGEEYKDNYEKTLEKFFEQLSSGTEINVSFDNEIIYTDGEENDNQKVDISYNDDGKSISFVVLVNDGYDDYSGNIYLDDTKIVMNIDEITDKNVVYNFGDSLEGTDLESFDMNYFKYSNIKKYVVLITELQKSGKLTEIAEDYENNFLEYLQKAKYTREGDVVTVVINDDLARDYLNQLADKILYDKNLREVYESFGIPYDYALIVSDIYDEICYVAEGIDDTFEIKYTGVIENGIFVKNNLTITDEYDDFEFNVDFNNIKNGILNDVKTEYSDGVDVYNYDYSLTTDGKKKFVEYKTKQNDELVAQGKYSYEIDNLHMIGNGELLMYDEPYFYVKEEPVMEEPTSYEDWLKAELTEIDGDIAFIKEYYTEDTERINERIKYRADYEKLYAKDGYEEYVERTKAYYEDDMKEYQEYVAYVENGSPKDVTKIIFDIENNLTTEKYDYKYNFSSVDEDEITNNCAINYVVQKSTQKNIIDTTNAINFKDCLNEEF